MRSNSRKPYLKGHTDAIELAAAIKPHAVILPPTTCTVHTCCRPRHGEQHTMHALTAWPVSSGADRLRYCPSAAARLISASRLSTAVTANITQLHTCCRPHTWERQTMHVPMVWSTATQLAAILSAVNSKSSRS